MSQSWIKTYHSKRARSNPATKTSEEYHPSKIAAPVWGMDLTSKEPCSRQVLRTWTFNKKSQRSILPIIINTSSIRPNTTRTSIKQESRSCRQRKTWSIWTLRNGSSTNIWHSRCMILWKHSATGIRLLREPRLMKRSWSRKKGKCKQLLMQELRKPKLQLVSWHQMKLRS